MKTKNTLLISFMLTIFIGLTSFAQDNLSVTGVFDGKEEYGYNFIVIDKDDIERTMTFHEIDKALLKTLDLDSEGFIGVKFDVTYSSEIETMLDENGDEEENEVLTITSLKPIY